MPITDSSRFFDAPGDVSLQLAPWKLEAEGLSIKVALFELREPIKFRSDIAGGVIVVRPPFRSDLASIPSWAWWLFMPSDDPRIELGGWVHDYLYDQEGQVPLEGGGRVALTRKQCDIILAYEAMPALGATRGEQWLVYYALRIFGVGWPNDSFFERFDWSH